MDRLSTHYIIQALEHTQFNSGTVFEPVLVACRIYTAYSTHHETGVVNVVLLQQPKQLVSIEEVLFCNIGGTVWKDLLYSALQTDREK